MMGQVIGIDIGGTNLRLGCVSADGQLHFERKSSAPMLKEGAVDVLCGEIMDYMERHSLKGAIDAVSVGVPSAVSKDKSFVYSTPNLKGLENIDLGNQGVCGQGCELSPVSRHQEIQSGPGAG